MGISKTTINYAERRGWEVVEQDDGVEFYRTQDQAEWDFRVTLQGKIEYMIWVDTEDMPAHVTYGEKQIRGIIDYLAGTVAA